MAQAPTSASCGGGVPSQALQRTLLLGSRRKHRRRL